MPAQAWSGRAVRFSLLAIQELERFTRMNHEASESAFASEAWL